MSTSDADPGDAAPLGDATGNWYYCFHHGRVETRDECHRGDRLGPYPTAEAAAHWRERVDARNEAWEAQDDDEDA